MKTNSYKNQWFYLSFLLEVVEGALIRPLASYMLVAEDTPVTSDALGQLKTWE